MPKRLSIGDIIEIPTTKGLAYAQYSHKHKQYGTMIRILDGLFESRPEDFAQLVKRKPKFVTFFPLGAAVNREIFYIVGHAEVPDEAKPFPIFRSGPPDRDGKVHNWWLWDGEKEWMVGHLSDEQRRLPIRSIVNDTALIYYIESGWTPESDSR